jgi:hypothetical protein
MKVILLTAAMILVVSACTSRFVRLEGVYELVSYRGKPLPFDGVRSGKINLALDGSFLAYTQRAAVIGRPESVTDTTPGTFRLAGWNGDCTEITLRFQDPSLELKVWGEVCGSELAIPDRGVLFRKRG